MVLEVRVHLKEQSEPVTVRDVRNAYTKGPLYCVMLNDERTVYTFPIQGIFRITEIRAAS